MNFKIGDLGHFFVIISFVTSLLAGFAYWQTSKTEGEVQTSWRKFARISFLCHALAVFGIIFTLFNIIYNHRYQYHYAWSHSSNQLPVHYMISCFWEGQEGSFLLWIFWHVLIGGVIIFRKTTWEAPVMTIFALVQAFLVSMILGVVIGEMKIGSSPFILLKDALDIPVFKTNPNFVPLDGNGLNPLLQNYWMVIHPPTLFLGFALTLVPFAYCIAGLWQNKYKEWVQVALPWVLAAALILGIGILMGAYWAYETLNFGGYWNWDPVENAVYIPWLVLIAAFHTMLVFRKNNTALKASIILTISSFLLILYATFLTRSGILGNASVHSFTDLGLSGQLFIYLASFIVIAVVFIIKAWRKIPVEKEEASTYSKEFWVFVGATLICLASFQVFISTSIPVYNTFMKFIGINANAAPPSDPVAHYSKFQIWFAVFILLVSSFGQFFWWRKVAKKNFQALLVPTILTLLAASLAIIFVEIKYFPYIILLTAALFSILANGKILLSVAAKNYKLSGGAVAHIGIAVMLVGILFSAGYSKVVSLNSTGLLLSKDEFFTKNGDKENKENTLLWLSKPQKMGEYTITYKGQYMEPMKLPFYLAKNTLEATDDPYKVITLEEIKVKNKVYHKRGDTLPILPENIYYKVEYKDAQGKTFDLFPRAQINPQMGLLASPDIKKNLTHDLYTHVSSVPDPAQEKEWSPTQEFTVSIKDTFFINDYVVLFDEVTRANEKEIMQLMSSPQAALKAHLSVMGEEKEYHVTPTFVVRNDGMVARIPEMIDDLGIKITLLTLDPEKKTFTFGVNTTQKDYIILKAMEKPMINLLWLGALVVCVGFGFSMVRRGKEAVNVGK